MIKFPGNANFLFQTKRLLIIFGIAFIAYGCLTRQVKKSSTDKYTLMQEVRDRVIEYFNYRKTNNLKAFYEILSPQFREKHSFDEFKSMPKEYTIGFLSYNINGIELEDNKRARVWVSEYFKPGSIPAFITMPNRELVWVKIEGQWYLEKGVDKKQSMKSCGNDAPRQTSGTSSSKACGN